MLQASVKPLSSAVIKRGPLLVEGVSTALAAEHPAERLLWALDTAIVLVPLLCPTPKSLLHRWQLSDTGVQDACRADGEAPVSCRGLQAGTPALMFASDRQVRFLSWVGVKLWPRSLSASVVYE